MIKVESKDCGNMARCTVQRVGSGALVSAELEALISELLNDGMPVELLDAIVESAKKRCKDPVKYNGELSKDRVDELVDEILDMLEKSRRRPHDNP